MYKIYFDGSPAENKYIVGLLVIENKVNSKMRGYDRIVYHTVKEVKYPGKITNNKAEYLALIEAIKYADKNNLDDIIFYGDSQLVVNQVNGKYRVKDNELFSLYKIVVNNLKKFLNARIEWIPRSKNWVVNSLIEGYKNETN